jgi:hypothetical protein
VASRVVFIDGGLIQVDGPPAEVFDQQQNERLRAFLARFVAFHRSERSRKAPASPPAVEPTA